jgi:hypothetical protein
MTAEDKPVRDVETVVEAIRQHRRDHRDRLTREIREGLDAPSHKIGEIGDDTLYLTPRERSRIGEDRRRLATLLDEFLRREPRAPG